MALKLARLGEIQAGETGLSAAERLEAGTRRGSEGAGFRDRQRRDRLSRSKRHEASRLAAQARQLKVHRFRAGTARSRLLAEMKRDEDERKRLYAENVSRRRSRTARRRFAKQPRETYAEYAAEQRSRS